MYMYVHVGVVRLSQQCPLLGFVKTVMNVISGFIMAANVKISTFYVVTPCSLVGMYR